MKPFDIAMISVHSSPTGRLGTRDTGGMSVYIRELAAVLADRGHRVDVYTRAANGKPPGRPLALGPGVRLIPLELGVAENTPKRALQAHLGRFFQALERFREADGAAYDLVHSHYWLSGIVGRLARQAWRAPHVTTFHTLGAVKNLVCGAGTEPAARIAAERELAAAADRVLVTSRRERDNLLRCCEIAPAQVSLAPCGVNLELFHPVDRAIARRRVGAGAHEALVLYVGRFAPEKGLARLIRAMAATPGPRLIVVGGDGKADPASREARQLSRELGVADRVTFVGRVEQGELPSYYSAADLLALPSSYESFGMVALEAMACGTPVVATRVGAMEELVRDGVNGKLVEGFHPSSLAETIRDFLPRAARRPAAANAIRRAALRYGWARVAAEVLKIYTATRAGAGAATHGGTPRQAQPSAACCGCGRH